MELSILCDSRVLLIAYNEHNRPFVYCSDNNPQSIIEDYIRDASTPGDTHELRCNADYGELSSRRAGVVGDHSDIYRRPAAAADDDDDDEEAEEEAEEEHEEQQGNGNGRQRTRGGRGKRGRNSGGTAGSFIIPHPSEQQQFDYSMYPQYVSQQQQQQQYEYPVGFVVLSLIAISLAWFEGYLSLLYPHCFRCHDATTSSDSHSDI